MIEAGSFAGNDAPRARQFGLARELCAFRLGDTRDRIREKRGKWRDLVKSSTTVASSRVPGSGSCLRLSRDPLLGGEVVVHEEIIGSFSSASSGTL